MVNPKPSSPSRPEHLRQGAAAEALGARWLEQRGWRIVGRNYRCKLGELDLIALDGGTLVFVEVRWRRSERFGGALASVDYRKQQRLVRTAQHYLLTHPRWQQAPCRFDVLALGSGPEGVQIDWRPAAFDAY